MKDKRLDILLEHIIIEKECRHFAPDQGMGFCTKMMEEGFPKSVDCSGSIKSCEVEE